jgi:dTDP-glucose 4,6-dehydratase
MRIMITGGAGFIGSAFVRLVLRETGHDVLVFDKFTYAASLGGVPRDHPRLKVVAGDICDAAAGETLARETPDAVLHLAAESHVDRSIDAPSAFIRTNIVGTHMLLEQAASYWRSLPPARAQAFRFHHVSTDEVFGSLGPQGLFAEDARYDPRSPYSASKAAADHLVRAWHHTYGLPVLVSNCSNNYGPWQFPEKLIPHLVTRALAGKTLPVYGRGENVRDWLHVEDHARALLAILERGQVGQSYNVGARCERRNIDVAREICAILDELQPRADGKTHAHAIAFVADRPGHDLRYAIDPSRIESDLGWRPKESFESGLCSTVAWYAQNRSWCDEIAAKGYDGARLGLGVGA